MKKIIEVYVEGSETAIGFLEDTIQGHCDHLSELESKAKARMIVEHPQRDCCEVCGKKEGFMVDYFAMLCQECSKKHTDRVLLEKIGVLQEKLNKLCGGDR